MIKDSYNTRDSYKIYREVSSSPVDIKDYVKIVGEFMKFLVKKLLDKGEVRIPERLGILKIVGRKVNFRVEDSKIKGLAPDWKSTKELWERDSNAKKDKQVVYHFNEETDGIRYKYLWSRDRVLVPNKSLFDLRMTREHKRELAKRIKSGQEYITIN